MPNIKRLFTLTTVNPKIKWNIVVMFRNKRK